MRANQLLSEIREIRDPCTSPERLQEVLRSVGRYMASDVVRHLDPDVPVVVGGMLYDYDGFSKGIADEFRENGLKVIVLLQDVVVKHLTGPDQPHLTDTSTMLEVKSEPVPPDAVLVLAIPVSGFGDELLNIHMGLRGEIHDQKYVHPIWVMSTIAGPRLRWSIERELLSSERKVAHFRTLAIDPGTGTDDMPSPGIGGSMVDRLERSEDQEWVIAACKSIVGDRWPTYREPAPSKADRNKF